MIYKVNVMGPFAHTRRVRAGIVVDTASGYEGELTKDQVDAIKADPLLSLRAIREASAAPKQPVAPQEAPVDSGGLPPVEPEREVPSEDWTRDQLDRYAALHGVEAPEKLSSKKDVRAAITAAETPDGA